MREENVEAVRKDTFKKRDEASQILRGCQVCKQRRPGVGLCEICQEMRAHLDECDYMLYLTERRLGNIGHSKLRHAFGAKHGRWPKDDDELYDWYMSLFKAPGHTQEERAAFNNLLGDIEIDL